MICEEYANLTSVGKILFIGELLHSAQSDSSIFSNCQELIRLGKLKGLFEGVTILPEEPLPPINNKP